jgi:hypothetical protein
MLKWGLLLAAAAVFLYSATVLSQAPEVEWEVILGDSLASDAGRGAFQTSDGGYIVGGNCNSWNGGYYDVVLFKLDSDGDTVWSAAEGGGSSQELASCFRLMPNGSYMFAGYSDQDTADGFAYLYNANPDGSYGWTGLYGSDTLSEIATAVAQASDTSYVTTSDFWWSPQTGYDFKFYYVGRTGWPSWIQSFHIDNTAEHAECIQTLEDGGYIITGMTQNPDYYDYEVLLVKLDEYGGILEWEQLGGSNDDAAEWVIETSDGGFLVTGYTKEIDGIGKDVYVIKTDSACTPIWQKIYGFNYHDQGFYCAETMDGGYVVGATCVADSTFDFWLLRLDSNGDTLWTKVIGRSGSQSLITVDITDDGGFLLCGNTQLTGEDADIYVVKVAPETGVENSDKPLPREMTYLDNYPNPFNGSTTIRFNSPMEMGATLRIFDIRGRVVRSYEISDGAGEITWDGVDESGKPVSSGVYFYRIEEKPSTTQKMVLLR